jgi:hypothetical protein
VRVPLRQNECAQLVERLVRFLFLQSDLQRVSIVSTRLQLLPEGAALAPIVRPPKPPRVCVGCGTPLRNSTHCHRCDVLESTKRLIRAAEKGRIAASAPDALARLAATQKRHAAAQLAWKPSDQPAWLTEQVFIGMIQPRLHAISVSTVMSALGVSRPYAVAIRLSRCRPHQRHWQTLARLVGVSPPK